MIAGVLKSRVDSISLHQREINVLLELPDIYQLDLSHACAVIFDSDSSSYYINTYPYEPQSNMKVVSSRQVIEDIGARDTGKKVTLIQDAYQMLAIPPTKFIRMKV